VHVKAAGLDKYQRIARHDANFVCVRIFLTAVGEHTSYSALYLDSPIFCIVNQEKKKEKQG